MDDIDKMIRETVLEVARQRAPDRVALEGHEKLVDDLGLDSLELAQIVAELEIKTGMDPFAKAGFPEVRTVDQLVSMYRQTR